MSLEKADQGNNSNNDLKIIQTALKDQDEVPPNNHRDYYARHFIIHQTGERKRDEIDNLRVKGWITERKKEIN